jgi:predicted alpha/beta hydrolase family esterase
MIYLLDFRESEVGGAIVPGRIVPEPGLGDELQLVAETRLIFLVHGYNVNRANGKQSLMRLAQRLSTVTSISGAGLVAVLWPGDHWTRAVSYSFEGRDADDSAMELVRYVDRVVTRNTALSFVSHSLGARVVMESVKGLKGKGYHIGQICLMAPAIDDSSLADPRVYQIASAVSDRTAVLASRQDKTLRYAYPAGDLLQAFVFFWKEEIDLALGYHGPRKSGTHPVPAKVYAEQIPDVRKSDHGHYIPAAPPTPNQLSAVQFASEVLQGTANPKYV